MTNRIPSGAASCLEYGIRAVWSMDGKRLYWMIFSGTPTRHLWRVV